MTLTKYVRARSLIAGLTLGAAVAFSAVAAAVSSATAQELEWATRAGGPNFENIFAGSIATDGSGSAIVTGDFSSQTVTFGRGEPYETTLTNSGPANEFDILVAKYDPNGRVIWATRAGGTDNAHAFNLRTDRSGSAIVTGEFAGTMTFGEGERNETTLTSSGGTDIFIAKYDPNGQLVWAARAGGAAGDRGRGIATDHSGGVIVTGGFTGIATFGEGERNETTLTSSGDQDIFVAKYNKKGHLLWASRAGGPNRSRRNFAQSTDIVTDVSGNSIVTGRFQNIVTFGEGERNETTLTGAADVNMFVAKYDQKGRLLWATGVRAAGEINYGAAIAIDARSAVVTGEFSGTVTFGEGEPNETTLTDSGRNNIFIAKYDPDGQLVWATQAGNPSGAAGYGIATDRGGSAIVTGLLYGSGTATFGEGERNETTLTSSGQGDIFIAKYDPNGQLVWATQAGGADVQYGQGIATDRDGRAIVTGLFFGTATFGEGEPNEIKLTSAGSSDIFVARYGSRPNGHGPVAHRGQSPCDPRGATPGGPRPGRC